MNIQALIEHELNQLGSGGPAMMAVADGPRNLSCDIVERNSLAVCSIYCGSPRRNWPAPMQSTWNESASRWPADSRI